MEGVRRVFEALTHGPAVPLYFLLVAAVWAARAAFKHFGNHAADSREVGGATEPANRGHSRVDGWLTAAVVVAGWFAAAQMFGVWWAIILGCAAAAFFCWTTGIFARSHGLLDSATNWVSRWSVNQRTASATETSGDCAESESTAATRERLWRTELDDELESTTYSHEPGDERKPWWPIVVAAAALLLLIGFVLWMPRGGSKEIASVTVTEDESTEPETVPAAPPLALAPIDEQSVNERETIRVTIGVQNTDSPRTHVRFSLGPNSPAAARIDADSGRFAWTTTEEDGPGIFPILVRVEDEQTGEFDEAALLVRVAEVDDPIELDEIDDQTIQAGDTLTLIASVRDPNVPRHDLRFSLSPDSPRGMTIDPETGALTWSPGDEQPAGEFPVTVRVREIGHPAPRVATRFTVTVKRPPAPVVAAVKEPPRPAEPMEEPTPPAVAMAEPPESPPTVAADEPQPTSPAMPVVTEPEAPSLLPVAMTEPAEPPTPTPAPVTNSIGMTLVPIAAGEFRMGSRESAEDLAELVNRPADRFRDELPLHAVRIARPFMMSKHEVTVGQFREFVLAEGYITEAERHERGGYGFDTESNRFERSSRFSWKNPGWRQTVDHPVVNVSWHDAVEFCRWLSKVEGRTYRLPTEAEWEYACRAGTETWYSTGDSADGLAASANLGDEQFRRAVRPNYHSISLASFEDGQSFTVPVGQFEPNGFGLCDMHGNVFEWCSDRYSPAYYAESPPDDPAGPSTGRTRAIRGGGFYSSPFYCRSAYRNGLAPETAVPYLGFRVVIADE
jgi:formylglycine-generating enzyme required for sulfatase activity